MAKDPRDICMQLFTNHGTGDVSLVEFQFHHNDDSWRLKKDHSGVRAYTRRIEGTPHLAFVGVTLANSTLNRLVEIHRDVDRMPSWLHTCYDPVIVGEVDTQTRIIHMKNSVPAWSRKLSLGAVSNRDLVLRQSIQFTSEASVVIDLTSAPALVACEKSHVRVPYFKGAWRFTGQADGQVEIIYEGVIDPGGKLPVAVTNAMVIDVPFNSVRDLRDIAEQEA